MKSGLGILQQKFTESISGKFWVNPLMMPFAPMSNKYWQDNKSAMRVKFLMKTAGHATLARLTFPNWINKETWKDLWRWLATLAMPKIQIGRAVQQECRDRSRMP